MTKAQLEKLEIYQTYPDSKLHREDYFIPSLSIHIKVYTHDTIESIYGKIFESGKKLGVEVGKRDKINEIKNALEIQPWQDLNGLLRTTLTRMRCKNLDGLTICFSNIETKTEFTYTVTLHQSNKIARAIIKIHNEVKFTICYGSDGRMFDLDKFDDFLKRKKVNPYISGYYSDMSEYSYLIHDGNNYKIGKSKNPISRLKQIKTGNPSANLVRFSNLITEKYLHSLFCDKRINGEWFNLRQSDVDYVLELMDITNIDLINAIVSCSIARILETKSTIPTKRRTPLKMKFGKYKGREIESFKSPEEIDYLKWWHSQTRNRDNKTDIDLEISNHLMKTIEGFKL